MKLNRQQSSQHEIRVRAEQELLTKIPEWKNPEVRTSEGTQLIDLLKSYEYTDEEINTLVDPRTTRMLRDYYLLKSKFEKATNAKQTIVKTPKSLKPGTPRVSDSGKQKLAAKMKAARDSRDNKVKVSAISDLLATRG